MTTPPHHEIINPTYCRSPDASFRVFQNLPKELRLHIWQLSIQQQRLLEINIESPPESESSSTPPYTTTNYLNKIISGQKYLAILHGCQQNSHLLYINHESRHIALQYYRIQIPCLHQKSESSDLKTAPKKTILYINPPNDIIRIKVIYPAQESVVDFIHDLQAYDPLNIGIQNFAIDTNSFTALDYHLQTISHPIAKGSWMDFLSRMENIIWIAESHCGRAILGPLDCFPEAGVRFNHSMPFRSVKPSFTLLKRDPREIGEDLKYVLTACLDPRRMRLHFQELLKRWKIERATPVRERVLFSYQVPEYHENSGIENVESAKEFLEMEEGMWYRSQERWKFIVERHAGKVPVESREELKRAVRPAVGFWLFPAEAMGELKGDLEHMKKTFDMRGFWPELALADIC